MAPCSGEKWKEKYVAVKVNFTSCSNLIFIQVAFKYLHVCQNASNTNTTQQQQHSNDKKTQAAATDLQTWKSIF